ncbi:MAG: hypothetical protein NTZ16_15050, partial [Verrucomicrobia bacterium]|nr:hypothetical protein [Verrucomicrobiota bacterium]
PRDIQIIGAVDTTFVLTNENGIIPASFVGSVQASNRISLGMSVPYSANTWKGFDPELPKRSFRVPLTNFFWSPTNCSWQSAAPASSLGYFTLPVITNFNQQGLEAPHWWLNVNTRLRFIMVDTASSRILDYVNLNSDAPTINVMQELAQKAADCSTSGNDSGPGGQWCTNKPATSAYTYTPTYGILNQIGVSDGSIKITPKNQTTWNNYLENAIAGNDMNLAITNFAKFMDKNGGSTNLSMRAPFSPYRTIYQYVSWQVNDPLVHYMAQDLTDLLGTAKTLQVDEVGESPIRSIGTVKPHYRPWGGNPYKKGTDTPPPYFTDYHLELKDPLAAWSDNWDFPTNKLPNIGWLGRVHRGTPWQTVYMKSATVDINTWIKWTGNADKNDAILTQPQKDWHLFDLFTTAPNANATRGQLPIHQTGLAAWSAVLGGVLTLSNNLADADVPGLYPGFFPSYAAFPIEPAGVTGGTNSAMQRIVDGINYTRASTNYNNGSFKHLGDILSVPELSTNSPFLHLSLTNQMRGISDAAYERVPQQIMSLLRLGDQPRFVIYAYGQSLKPADRSIVSGGIPGLCTNYQITGESAVRAVVRVEGVGVNEATPYRPRVVIESYNNLPPD